MRILLLILIFVGLHAKTVEITPSDVYSQVDRIERSVDYLLKYYDVPFDKKKSYEEVSRIRTKMKPRNVWQKSYEVLIKINILRQTHGLPIIEPVNMVPVLHLNPDLVYEQTQRILTELRIFAFRMQIPLPEFKTRKFSHKIPSDVFKGLTLVSLSLDALNKKAFTPSHVFGQNMRIYDDITLILSTLGIEDKTIPTKKNKNATPKDTFAVALKILEKIKQLQILAGIDYVDFSTYTKSNPTPSDVFSISEMIIAEIQTLKAYLKITSITPPAHRYKDKTPAEVDQLMHWNLRKLELIGTLIKGKTNVQ